MSFPWKAYYDLAREISSSATPHPSLLSTTSPEARARCAISRAYYAAFNLARLHAVTIEGAIISATGKAHSEVGNAFSNGRTREHKLIGAFLDSLRLMRNQADYDDSVESLVCKMKGALAETSKVIELLQQLSPPPPYTS